MSEEKQNAANSQRPKDNEVNEGDLRSEEREGSLLRLLTERSDIGGGGEVKDLKTEGIKIPKETETPLRYITHLCRRPEPGQENLAPVLVGEWRTAVSFDDIFKEFNMRSKLAMGLELSKEAFMQRFEIVRYKETPEH